MLTTSSMVIMRTMLGSVAKQRAELRLMGQGAGGIGLCILGICGPNASLASTRLEVSVYGGPSP